MLVTYFKIQNLNNTTQGDKIFAIGKAMSEFLTNEEISELVFDTHTDNPIEIVVAFLPDYKINRLRAVFINAEILIEEIDITDYILTGKIQKNKYLNDILKNANALTLLEFFLRNNLTTDLILDKISDLGVEFLTELDKEILTT